MLHLIDEISGLHGIVFYYLHTIVSNYLTNFISSQEAFESFSSSPFFRNWDPAVLNIYVECGLYDTTDSATGQHIVRLKTSGLQEAVVLLCDKFSCQDTFQRMRNLDEGIPLRWILGREECIGGPSDTRRRVWVRPKNSANIKIRGAGHLVCYAFSVLQTHF